MSDRMTKVMIPIPAFSDFSILGLFSVPSAFSVVNPLFHHRSPQARRAPRSNQLSR